MRVMHVDAHYHRGVKVDIIVDASPWGIGGILSLDGHPCEHFAVATTHDDARHLGVEITRDSRCQQAFEALAMLIALRHWHYQWAHRRCVIHVSGDNMAALSMITRMQPHSYSLGVVARELALDIADAVYEPQLASHVPGVANIAADCLSRKFQPDKKFVLPEVLADSTEVHPAERNDAWWRMLTPRASHKPGKQGSKSSESSRTGRKDHSNSR